MTKLNFKGKIIDIRNIEGFEIDNIKEADLHYKLDVTKEAENSKIQFKELSKLFN